MIDERAVKAMDGREIWTSWAVPQRPQAVVVLGPAMGVKRQFYRAFVEFLAAGGLAVVSLDWRGIGDNAGAADKATRLVDWADQDLVAVLRDARLAFPGLKVGYVGHSVGGQLLGLLPEGSVDAALLVAAQSGHWRHWPGAGRATMFGIWYGALPLLVGLSGKLPMKAMGQGEDVPAGVARQWAEWGRDPDYILVEARQRSGIIYGGWAGPLEMVGFSDDAYAPEAAVRALAECYAAAKPRVTVHRPEELGVKALGHFGPFKRSFQENLWGPWRAWLSGALTGDVAATSPSGEASSGSAPATTVEGPSGPSTPSRPS